ncbi:MAG: sensor domain-containing diguanylate cyclase, partial [Pseudomonadota bacterium]
IIRRDIAAKSADHFNEYRINRPDGSQGWHMTKGRITYTQDGRPRYMTGIVMDISARKEMEERNLYLATHDSLTGLPNRAMFSELLDTEMSLARRHGSGFAVLFMDMDSFKPVNDTLGHKAGDTLLREFATRLRGCTRDSDIAARLGGDEFVLLLRRTVSRGQVASFVEKLMAVARQPFDISGHECRISLSIGVSLYAGHGDCNAETLIKQADSAMYEAKRNGKDCYEFNTAPGQPGAEST